jgi:hypothetical protein
MHQKFSDWQRAALFRNTTELMATISSQRESAKTDVLEGS